jgi:hypothetical protein
LKLIQISLEFKEMNFGVGRLNEPEKQIPLLLARAIARKKGN